MPLPLVAIVGRPNVGKSTLFNRICGGRHAIVEPQPGVTRDVVEREAEWAGRRFRLADTGGLLAPGEGDPLDAAVEARAREALRAARVVLFVVDARAGLTGADLAIADELRPRRGRVLLVANKAEAEAARQGAVDFFRLGMGEPIAVSAEHGLGIGELLDAVVGRLGEGARETARDGASGEDGPAVVGAGEDERRVRVAVVGRPNVGKSSLVNRLIGRERQIVADRPGTTRDAVDLVWRASGREYVLVDTAGLRRPGRLGRGVEFHAALRAERAIARADVALLLLDATEGVTAQDRRVAGAVQSAGRPVGILLNKWDAAAEAGLTAEDAVREVRADLDFLHYAPILPVSARTGFRVGRLAEVVDRLDRAAGRTVPTPELNRVLQDLQERQPPPAVRGRELRIYYGTQSGVRPPTFLLFVNDRERVHFSYARYIENRLREAFDLSGTPIRLSFRTRARREASPLPKA